MSDEIRYGVRLKGERASYEITAWSDLSFDEVCAVLSDVTGYKPEFLAKELPKLFDRLGYATVKPAACNWGEVPQFHVRSHDGRVPK